MKQHARSTDSCTLATFHFSNQTSEHYKSYQVIQNDAITELKSPKSKMFPQIHQEVPVRTQEIEEQEFSEFDTKKCDSVPAIAGVFCSECSRSDTCTVFPSDKRVFYTDRMFMREITMMVVNSSSAPRVMANDIVVPGDRKMVPIHPDIPSCWHCY